MIDKYGHNFILTRSNSPFTGAEDYKCSVCGIIYCVDTKYENFFYAEVDGYNMRFYTSNNKDMVPPSCGEMLLKYIL